MDATTTRASTVIRSMPTRETRTQASMTMPLSSTRSRTSMRLVPPTVRSTGIRQPPSTPPGSCRAPTSKLPPTGERRDPVLQDLDLFTQVRILRRDTLVAGREVMIVPPPVQPDLLCLVQRAYDQPDADREELDFGERDLDVPCDHEPLVEHSIEHIDEPGASRS